MTTITLHDDTTDEKVVLRFVPTEGSDVHHIDVDMITDMEEIKAKATPMFKTAMFNLFHAFGLAQQKPIDEE